MTLLCASFYTQLKDLLISWGWIQVLISWQHQVSSFIYIQPKWGKPKKQDLTQRNLTVFPPV